MLPHSCPLSKGCVHTMLCCHDAECLDTCQSAVYMVPCCYCLCFCCSQVNAAIDEVAGFAESVHKSMAAVARNQLGRMGAEERQRLHGMYHNIAVSNST